MASSAYILAKYNMCRKPLAPSGKELEWAVRVTVADKRADQQGRGAWTLDGHVIDEPVVGKGQSIVRKAEACGLMSTQSGENGRIKNLNDFIHLYNAEG